MSGETIDAIKAQDTPTHRATLYQFSMQRVLEFTQQLQARRAVIVERAARIKKNSKLEREAQVNKQLTRLFKKLDKLLVSVESDLDTIADETNKARALIYELSDGEVLLDKAELTNGSIANSKKD